MPAPATADELLDLLGKSNLVEEPKLRAYVQKLRDAGGLPADAHKFAQFLVRDAIVTQFQAEQLLQGKYKRFSLGKYKVLEKLGSGGMGTVFLCEHKLMRRRVAVKVLPVPKSEDKASLDRFYREAKAAAAVDHPNLVRAYDIDQDENLHFLVMEWVDGINLQDLVKRFGPLDVTRACHYMYGSAVGLQHAYEIGLIHRDIKPGNILVDRSGVVKILDLGLARLTQDVDDNLTRQNDENVLGTADYLAPEQAIDSHTVDIRADIYSLGATFYFLLTGSPPFPEGSVAQKLIWHQSRPPRPLKSLRAELPDAVVAIVERMMAKEAKDRYQTPSEVMTALSGFVATPIPPPAEKEMPTLSPAAAGERSGRPSAPPSMVGVPSMVGGAILRTPPAAIDSGALTPTPTAATAYEEPAVWATLDGETQGDRPGGDTERPETGRSSRVRDRKAPPAARAPGGRKRKVVFLAVGTVLLAAAATGVYFGFFAGKDPAPINPTPSGARKIVVSKTAGEGVVGSLREALNKAQPGDTIVIAESRIIEGASPRPLKLKDVTIESGTPDGKPAVIEFHPNAKGVMFDVTATDGLRLRNLEFDGKGRAEQGIRVADFAYGMTLENVTVRGVVGAGISLRSVAGDEKRPVTLDRVRVILGEKPEAVGVEVSAGNADSKFVTLKGCRFEGPARTGTGVRVEGPFQALDIRDCRFFNLNVAVHFAFPAGRPSKGTVANNTVYGANVGFLFDPPPKDVAPTPYAIHVTLNLLVRTGEWLKMSVQVPQLNADVGIHDAGSARGLPEPPNPDDNATFLRFPPGGAPTVGPNKLRVGAFAN